MQKRCDQELVWQTLDRRVVVDVGMIQGHDTQLRPHFCNLDTSVRVCNVGSSIRVRRGCIGAWSDVQRCAYAGRDSATVNGQLRLMSVGPLTVSVTVAGPMRALIIFF
jgi:hypothetical protein